MKLKNAEHFDDEKNNDTTKWKIINLAENFSNMLTLWATQKKIHISKKNPFSLIENATEILWCKSVWWFNEKILILIY